MVGSGSARSRDVLTFFLSRFRSRDFSIFVLLDGINFYIPS